MSTAVGELRQPKAIFSTAILDQMIEEMKLRHEARVEAREIAKEEKLQQRAESRYDKIRDKLIYASAGYSKAAVETFNKIFEEHGKLTPAEKKEFADLISSGVRSAERAGANGQKYAALFDAISDGVKAKVITWEKSTFLLDTAITVGVSAVKLTAYVGAAISSNVWMGPAIDVGVSALKHGLHRVLDQANKRGLVGNVLSDENLMEAIKGIEADIQKLSEELDREKPEWVAKAKEMKQSEFEEAFAKYMEEKVKTLNLENISARLISEAVGKKGRKKGQSTEQQQGDPNQTTNEAENTQVGREIDTLSQGE